MGNVNDNWIDLITHSAGRVDSTTGLSDEQRQVRARETMVPLSRLDGIFTACANQQRTYDLTFEVANPITFDAECETARASRNRDLTDMLLTTIDAGTAKLGGPEPQVLARYTGSGLFAPTAVYRLNDGVQLEQALEAVREELPTLVPGITARPGQNRSMGCVASGNNDTILVFANSIRRLYMPKYWGLTYGQLPGCNDTLVWLFVSLTGKELVHYYSYSTDNLPPKPLLKWLERIQGTNGQPKTK